MFEILALPTFTKRDHWSLDLVDHTHRYQFNELASLGRCKLSFEAQERAVAIAKTEALTLAGIMTRLRQEKLVPKSETNGRYALADTLKRAGMSFQRTRYSLKKARSPAL